MVVVVVVVVVVGVVVVSVLVWHSSPVKPSAHLPATSNVITIKLAFSV